MIRVIYLVLKISYMSVWFYWGGYIVPIASYIYPYANDKYLDAKAEFYDSYMTDGVPGKAKPLHDERGYTLEDFQTEMNLWDNNENFGRYFAHDYRFNRIDQDEWIFSFYLYDSIL